MKEVVVGLVSRLNEIGEKEYLLVSSKKDFGEFTGSYYPPGGHMEEGEGKVQTLKREFMEELGVEIEPLEEVAQTPGDVKDQITYWWKCKLTDTNFKIKSDEIADVGFFTKEKIENLKIWPATKDFFERYIF